MKISNKVAIIIILFIVITCIMFISIYKPDFFECFFNKVEVPKIFSTIDYDKDGIVDSEEFLIGARNDVKNKVKYVNEYYKGGYPPDDKGVCTDVIWRAFKEAGYTLKEMVNEDIKSNRNDYPWISSIDKNIDFRRVRNLEVFFDRYAITLTNDVIPTDIDNLSQWQGGDIVIFGKYQHIAIISDKRNYKGVPYIIHNASTYAKEEDALLMLRDFSGGITKHYRFSK